MLAYKLLQESDFHEKMGLVWVKMKLIRSKDAAEEVVSAAEWDSGGLGMIMPKVLHSGT